MFSLHTINSLSICDLQNINGNKSIHQQSINTTELPQSSKQELNITLPLLPNFNTPLSTLRRQKKLHFNNCTTNSKNNSAVTKNSNSQQNIQLK